MNVGRDGNGSFDRERAVSELVGFAVVFGVVVLSISLVYTFGISALTELQSGEAVDNAGRAFDILADNMDDVHRNGAPGRSTELEFESGELATTGRVTMTVNTTTTPSMSFAATPISYTRGEDGLHYATGAVLRTNRDSAAMVNDPPFRFSDERVVISFVETKPVGDTTSIGGGTVRVEGRWRGTNVEVNDTGGVEFNVSVTSPRHEAWRRYFESREPQPQLCATDAANDTVVCQYETKQLFVRRTLVHVRLTQ